jgi:7,8-dihydro-6-hydroxymethylpterin-pyrophosphokinase
MLNETALQVPHPEISNRRFVLVPLKEIASEFQDPLRHLSVEELLQRCSDTSAVRKTNQKILLQVKV